MLDQHSATGTSHDSPPNLRRVAKVFFTRATRDGVRIPSIFISYRREDTAGEAGHLADALRSRFGSNVFIDVDSISPGVDFEEKITNALRLCRVAFVLIGKHWLTEALPDGTRRLHDKRDYVRKEVALALERPDLQVVPVLVEGADMPSQDELPSDIARLTRLNAFELSNKRWQFDVRQLSEVALHYDTWWHRLPRWVTRGVPLVGVAVAATSLVIILLTPGPSGWTSCDPNVSAFARTTSCEFAQNTFYEYWKATGGKSTHGARALEVWSPRTRLTYTQDCTDHGGEVNCTHHEGDAVRFSQASVMAYTQGEAKAYAASGTLGPQSP